MSKAKGGKASSEEKENLVRRDINLLVK